jgi:plastocyanin
MKARTAAIATLAIALAACSDSNSPNNPPPATATVTATTSQTFSPRTAQVATGGTVTWVFQSLGHNVTFDAATGVPADIPGVNANTSIARTFATAGTYQYHCTIHPGMTGTVEVSAAAAPAKSPTDGGTNAPPPGY